jgi:RNA polymerase sigma factor (sigma-70 family)
VRGVVRDVDGRAPPHSGKDSLSPTLRDVSHSQDRTDEGTQYGREDYFRRLYLEHREAMLAYALRRSRDTHEAQDWVAETFLVVWRRIDSLPPDVEVRPWLYGVIRRVAANRYRSQARREAVRQRLMSRPESVADVHANAVEREELRHVVEGLLGLKEPDREILLLAAWERLSTAEIAVVLDCSDNAAAIRLHRARRRLGEAVEKSIGPNAHGDMEAPRQLPKSKGGQ